MRCDTSKGSLQVYRRPADASNPRGGRSRARRRPVATPQAVALHAQQRGPGTGRQRTSRTLAQGARSTPDLATVRVRASAGQAESKHPISGCEAVKHDLSAFQDSEPTTARRDSPDGRNVGALLPVRGGSAPSEPPSRSTSGRGNKRRRGVAGPRPEQPVGRAARRQYRHEQSAVAKVRERVRRVTGTPLKDGSGQVGQGNNACWAGARGTRSFPRLQLSSTPKATS